MLKEEGSLLWWAHASCSFKKLFYADMRAGVWLHDQDLNPFQDDGMMIGPTQHDEEPLISQYESNTGPNLSS